MNRTGVLNRVNVFARRNIKELLRSPIGWVFGLLLPIGIFVIMQVVIKSIPGGATNVPMFGVDRFTGGVMIFGASFLSLFCALVILGDCKQSFLSRLAVSPMTAGEFICGYVVGVLPIAAAQVVVTYVVALCFGLTATVNILPAVLLSMIVGLLFVSIGVVMGSLLPEKNAPPLCSVVVQIAALLSGMWFDLDAIGGGFSVFCHVLPFAHAYDLIRYTLAGNYAEVWLPALVVSLYTAALAVCAVFAFKYKMKRL